MNTIVSFADRLQELLDFFHINASELSRRSGVSKSSISHYLKGDWEAKQDKIFAIAESMGVDEGWLMGRDVPMLSPLNVIPLPKMRKVPLLGDIACGEPILAAENIEEYVNMPDELHADFALRCRGDSMIEAQIHDGDTVYVRQQPTVENGQIAAVIIGNEATLKRVYYAENGTVMLQPANSAYAPILFSPDSGDEMRILGLAVGHYRPLV